MNQGKPITLTDEQRAKLERRVRSQTPPCLPVGKVADQNQNETDGTDAAPPDPAAPGYDSGKSKPQPERLGELLPLPEFEHGTGKGQAACGTTAAHAPDEAPQSERPWDWRRPVPECRSLPALWALQSSDGSGLEIGACLGVKNIGKPCAGKPHARFDEGGQARACSLLYPRISCAILEI